METSVAFSVCQVSCADWPAVTVAGFAEIDAVGEGGGGGGGAGVGFGFLWQPAMTNNKHNAAICVACIH
jgi:hypothetical protein